MAGVDAGGPSLAEALERGVREALEAAAIQGLCEEGQIEAAVGFVRSASPELSAEQALMTVRRIAATR